jgi:hypothetical protein
MAPEPVLIGAVGTRAALMSALPEPATTSDEVRSYVETLLRAQRIELPETRRLGRRRGAVAPSSESLPTHVVRAQGNKKILVRVRFACRACRGHGSDG